ncbi:MAG: hypothetical protein AAFR38_07430 [Planctomycetota bacterium]
MDFRRWGSLGCRKKRRLLATGEERNGLVFRNETRCSASPARGGDAGEGEGAGGAGAWDQYQGRAEAHLEALGDEAAVVGAGGETQVGNAGLDQQRTGSVRDLEAEERFLTVGADAVVGTEAAEEGDEVLDDDLAGGLGDDDEAAGGLSGLSRSTTLPSTICASPVIRTARPVAPTLSTDAEAATVTVNVSPS